jgi:hypothetical protein
MYISQSDKQQRVFVLHATLSHVMSHRASLQRARHIALVFTDPTAAFKLISF